ncbi:transposase, partial [Micromonospora sp. B11E3]|uniref:transposase n=1 Tax=Micromonospora sp. B11E3 TaxID=3153562 RepID=UPI00325F1A47
PGGPPRPTGSHAHAAHRCTSSVRASLVFLPGFDVSIKPGAEQPYASAKRVFWVVDNGSSHRGQAAADRLSRRFPNAVMVHTPIHASWVNQVEIYFSIIQRKVLTPNDFTSLDQVEDRLTAFEQRYNATARPFRWRFTPADLEDLMARIERHEQKEQNLQQPTGCDHQPAAHALAA